MKLVIENMIRLFVRFILLIILCCFQLSIIPVSASPVIFDQDHHICISEIYTYDEIESSAHVEVDHTAGLSQVLSVKEVRADHEVLAGVASVVTKGGKSVLSAGELARIENAATRINKPITVVGSRASGKAGAYSDWDYVIEGLNSKNWSKIKNSLPGSRSILDNTPRNIDIFKGPVNPNLPHITINPR